ncbi:MAG TPA: TadE/TadG family type IV pilus assembly protein [Caulobacteraceae bacterium]|jgi:Flp pilus assembly protein TadG|nr:TadE/TadG family type IV pilus assembly protein [Caulobacteraceae bacterium]
MRRLGTGVARTLRLGEDSAGVAAVEFALILPVFGVLLAGIVDLGNVLYTRFRLDSAVSAAADYVQVNAASVSSTGGATLASNAATIVQSSQGSNWADASVTINNGPVATVNNGNTTTSGTTANADNCYCPTYSGGTTTWGAAVACASACPSGPSAGKFVTITASRTYTPLFSTYGIVQNGTISTSATVETQ